MVHRLCVGALGYVLGLTACAGSSDPRGAACASDAECGTLRCAADPDATPADLAPLMLVCADEQPGAEPGEGCEEADDCARGICLLAGTCARPCGGDADCDASERCQAAFARAGTDALETVSACVARVNLPDDVDVSAETRRHALQAGDNRVELGPAQAEGSTLYVLEHSRDTWPDTTSCRPPLCLRSLRTLDATPALLFDAAADYVSEDAPQNPVATGDHVNPVEILFPSGARSALSAAGYSAVLATEQPGDLRITRLAGRRDGGVLDLNVFYVGALDWKPEGNRGPPLLADALDVVDEIFGQAGISIGNVRQIAVPGALPMRGTTFPDGDSKQGFAVLQVRFGVYAELPALFRLSAGANDSAIDLFFVQDIQPLVGGEPEAQAGGIPGPLGMHGTAGSGIAIATDMMEGDPQRLGRTLAHELGHFLGLFHTSEVDGSVYDALSDTPECRLDRDVAGDGLDVSDCQDAGADNLMFWARTSGTVLTPQQQAVLRGALVLQ